MTDDRDLAPDNGKSPPFAKPDPKMNRVGTGSGYSGQEYDSVDQAEWRAADAARGVSPDGEVHGTGSPAEEIDSATPGSQERPFAGAAPDRATSSESERRT